MDNYQIIIDRSIPKLQTRVNKLIKDGYSLSGGINIFKGSENSYTGEYVENSIINFLQVVYKDEQNNIEKKYIGETHDKN